MQFLKIRGRDKSSMFAKVGRPKRPMFEPSQDDQKLNFWAFKNTIFHNLADLKTAMFAQEQFLKIEATKNIVFEVKKRFQTLLFWRFSNCKLCTFAKSEGVQNLKFCKIWKEPLLDFDNLQNFKFQNLKRQKIETETLFCCKLPGGLLLAPWGDLGGIGGECKIAK